MALSEVHTFPEFSQFDLTMEVGPTKLNFRMTFRERMKSWYLDIFELNGTPLMLGRRIGPTWILTNGFTNVEQLMAGVLYGLGIDGDKQEDLGGTLKIYYIPEEDFFFFQSDLVDPLDPIVTITSP